MNPNWQKILASSIRNIDELLNFLEIENYREDLSIDNNSSFPLLAPLPYLKRIKKGDPTDPLLRQLIPLHIENNEKEGFNIDPLNEQLFRKSRGVIHKYEGRVLIIVTGACAIHCRYCFRRHYPYSESSVKISQFENTLEYIQSDKTIHEVILSGGDPLSMPDSTIDSLIKRLEKISHLRTIRIHTRLPVVIPERITNSLLNILKSTRLKPVIVLHINHSNEIDNEVTNIIESLRSIGLLILNQSVLLKGVNDDANILKDLSFSLFQANVIPYYLHLLDKTKGVSHFDVEEDRAKIIYRDLKDSLPGYLVPKLVREIPGQKSKSYIY